MQKMLHILEVGQFISLGHKLNMTWQRQTIPITFWWFSLAPGPENWSAVYSLCAGKFQSPVNNVTKKAKKKSYSPLKVTFDNPCGLVTGQIVNGGHAPAFNVDNAKGGAKLSGGPLECDEYTLQQFHFHFGCENSRGSEHTVNNKSYAAQVSRSYILFLHVLLRVFFYKTKVYVWKSHNINLPFAFFFTLIHVNYSIMYLPSFYLSSI